MKWQLGCLLAVLVEAVRVEPKWEAMVINLARRRDRILSFADSMNQSEPWLYNSKKLCRVPGRNGKVLLGADNSFLAVRRRPRDLNEDRSILDAVPVNLDDQDLYSHGWFTMEALHAVREPSSRWPAMTAGGVGLFLGHADAWRRVVERRLDYGIIFEDDLSFYAPNFEVEVSAILKSPDPPDWDFLYLQQDIPSWPKNTPYPYKKEVTSRLQKLSGLVPNTGAYIVTQLGAQKLLTGAFPATKQLDYQITYVENLRRSALSPTVAQCNEHRSSKFSDIVYRDSDVQDGQGSESFKNLKGAISHLSDVLAAASSDGHKKELPPSPIADCKE